MAKEALKKIITEDQGGACALTGAALPEETALYDTDRKTPKADGGIYLVDNTRTVDPRAHMERHGNLRQRDADLEVLKTQIDDRSQMLKLFMKINNQLLAYERLTDEPNPATVEWLKNQADGIKSELKDRDKVLIKAVKTAADSNPLVAAAMGVRAVGPISVAYCTVYIDIEKARHASSLWSYAGLHKASHERYKKGEASGGNKKLRTVLYTMAESQMKLAGAYRPVYDNVKARLSMSENIVKTRNTKGVLIECAWKDTKPSHRHGAALRAVMKHFLADYWYVGRTLAGLDTTPIYAEAMLGGTHRTIMPVERGWEY